MRYQDSHDLDSLLSNRCQSEHLSEVGVSVSQARDLEADQPGVLHTLRHPAQGGDALVVHQGHLHIDDFTQKIKYQNIPLVWNFQHFFGKTLQGIKWLIRWRYTDLVLCFHYKCQS